MLFVMVARAKTVCHLLSLKASHALSYHLAFATCLAFVTHHPLGLELISSPHQYNLLLFILQKLTHLLIINSRNTSSIRCSLALPDRFHIPSSIDRSFLSLTLSQLFPINDFVSPTGLWDFWDQRAGTFLKSVSAEENIAPKSFFDTQHIFVELMTEIHGCLGPFSVCIQ